MTSKDEKKEKGNREKLKRRDKKDRNLNNDGGKRRITRIDEGFGNDDTQRRPPKDKK